MSSLSSQSQEAILAIDEELETILDKKKLKEGENAEGSDTEEDVHTESEIDEGQEKKKKVKRKSSAKKQNSPRKRTRGDYEVERIGAKYASKQLKTSKSTILEEKEANAESLIPPTLQRTRSLEVLRNVSPSQVCCSVF